MPVLLLALAIGSLAAADAPPGPVPTNAAPAASEPSTNPPPASASETNLVPSAPAVAQALTNESQSLTNAKPEPTNAAPPADALKEFRIAPGFRIEVAAADPVVVSPAAMAFDESGRLFVAEMRDWPRAREAKPHLGRIRLLEDPEGEGTFSTSTIYADDLPWPSAVACYDGGVFVAVAPVILYLKDSTVAGNADERRVIYTGLGSTNDFNALVNNFKWGPDCRIHGARGGSGAAGVRTVDASGPVAGDFSFDPRSAGLSEETGRAQSGLAFDGAGRKFMCAYSRPLQTVLFSQKYIARNPFFPAVPAILDACLPATPVFLAVAEPASNNIPVAGKSPRGPGAPVASTNATRMAWLGSARGMAIYRGGIFPTNYHGNAFVPDPEARVIHRAVLRENGLDVMGLRSADDRDREFLSSTDPDFHPVQVVEGPEGALYVADMRKGSDTGRIYRIVPVTWKNTKLPSLAKAKTHDLLAALAQPGGWQQDTASRLIVERRDPASVPLLTNMLSNARQPLVRLRAVRMLASLGAINEARALRALRDPDERVREQALRSIEPSLAAGAVPDVIMSQLRIMTSDSSFRVRLQLAFTLGEVRHPARNAALASLLARDFGSDYMQTAVLSSLSYGGADFAAILTGNAAFRDSPAGTAFLRTLAVTIGVQGRGEEVVALIDFVDKANLPLGTAYLLVEGLGAGLRHTASNLGLVDPHGGLQRLYIGALNGLLGGSTESVQSGAVRVLGESQVPYQQLAEVLLRLPGSTVSPTLQSAALHALGNRPDPPVATDLLARLPGFPPSLRNEAVGALLNRIERVPSVVHALESGQVRPTDLASWQINLLRAFRDPAIAQRAVQVFGPVRPERPEVLSAARPALRLAGNAPRGRSLFLGRCAACHRLKGEGWSVGPDLAGLKPAGKEAMLAAILQPSAQLAAGYETQVVEAANGELAVGVISANHGNAGIELTQPGGVRTVWARAGIQHVQAQPWSLMPDGLENGLTAQDLADLLDYIFSAPAR